jgi:7 transmembrane receptor (Secretin family)
LLGRTPRSRLGGHRSSVPDVRAHLQEADVSTFLWILLGALYLTVLIVLGVATLRKGHYLLFVFGIFFPILWVVGAVIGPTERASAADATTGLQ